MPPLQLCGVISIKRVALAPPCAARFLFVGLPLLPDLAGRLGLFPRLEVGLHHHSEVGVVPPDDLIVAGDVVFPDRVIRIDLHPTLHSEITNAKIRISVATVTVAARM